MTRLRTSTLAAATAMAFAGWLTIPAQASTVDSAAVTASSVSSSEPGHAHASAALTTHTPSGRYVVLGDSVPYGHGLANPGKKPAGGLPADMPPSSQAWPQLVQQGLGLKPLRYRQTGCDLGKPDAYDQLAVSGAPAVANPGTGKDTNCHYTGPVPLHKAVDPTELHAAGLSADPPALVTIQVGADDIDFAACLGSVLGVPVNPTQHVERCFNVDASGHYRLTTKVASELADMQQGLRATIDTVHNNAPHASIALVDYYQIIPTPTEPLQGTSAICRDLRLSSPGGQFRTHIRAQADFLQAQLNGALSAVASSYADVVFVDIASTFAGHEMCTAQSWVFDGIWDAAHPTAIGQQHMAGMVLTTCTPDIRGCSGRIGGPVLQGGPLPSGTVGMSYDAPLTITGGVPPYQVSVATGALPAGISVSPVNHLSGTPAAAGTSTFTLAVRDSGDQQSTTSFQMTVAKGGGSTGGGSVLTWGSNHSGQLGNGTLGVSGCECSTLPMPVSLPAGVTVTAVAGGGEHSLALTSTGSVLAWGSNYYGQLGNGTTTTTACGCIPLPVEVSLPAGVTVTAIAAGAWHSLALTSTGSVLAWGDNYYGQLGNGTTTTTGCGCSPLPVQVSLPAGVTITAVAAGGNHSLALTSTGSVLACGADEVGELGNGASTTWGDYFYSNLPVPVSLPAGVVVTALAVGQYHSLALTSTGSVLAWGYNQDGELGNGTPTATGCTCNSLPVPVSLPAGVRVTAVTAGSFQGFAMTSTGTVWAWGVDGEDIPTG